MRAFGRPHLRPYLPDLRFARTVGAGLCVICTAGWAAVRRAMKAVLGAPTKRPETRGEAADAVERLGMGALMVGVVVAAGAGVVTAVSQHLAPYLPWVAGVGVLVLLGAACAVAPAATPERKIVSNGGEAPTPAPTPGVDPLTAAEVAAVVRQLAAAGGWLGAHLDDILAHLPGRSREELLGALAAAGIEVADQLKLTLPGGRQRNRRGVRLTALPAGLGEAPATPATTPPVGAAEPAPEPAPPTVPLTVHGQQ